MKSTHLSHDKTQLCRELLFRFSVPALVQAVISARMCMVQLAPFSADRGDLSTG